MSLVPLGISGGSTGSQTNPSTGSGTGASSPPPPSWPSVKSGDGMIYALGQWSGQTLRHLSLAGQATSYAFSRLQIATDYPRDGLYPYNALHNALYDIPIWISGGNNILVLNFDPGLITVLPGETLYLIVYDFYSPNTGDQTFWRLNMFWEPFGLGGGK